MVASRMSVAFVLVVAAACSKSDSAPSDSARMASDSMASASAAGNSTMAGGAMAGGAMAGGAMAGGSAMTAHSDSIAAHAQMHLDSLTAATPEAAVKRVPEYKQAVMALLEDCEKMMKDQKMTPPDKWNTAAAAVRADLTAMGSAKASALHAMIPAHADRVKGILGMRKDMMKM
jgi:hypothetical protein